MSSVSFLFGATIFTLALLMVSIVSITVGSYIELWFRVWRFKRARTARSGAYTVDNGIITRLAELGACLVFLFLNRSLLHGLFDGTPLWTLVLISLSLALVRVMIVDNYYKARMEWIFNRVGRDIWIG